MTNSEPTAYKVPLGMLAEIAKEHLDIDQLTPRNSDALDFHDCAVWSVEAALTAAFNAGRATCRTNLADKLRLDLLEQYAQTGGSDAARLVAMTAGVSSDPLRILREIAEADTDEHPVSAQTSAAAQSLLRRLRLD